MRQTRNIMGMPITIELNSRPSIAQPLLEKVFDFFMRIDAQFSTYKPTSEISLINAGTITITDASALMKFILHLCDQTKQISKGYFDIMHNGKLDPSGLIKGWAIRKAANILRQAHQSDFFISAGGDIELSGTTEKGDLWQVGIRHPFNEKEIVKRLALSGYGIATSGTYIRGQHIYNPFRPNELQQEVVSLTVIGPDVYEADRFATAAFAMGKAGIAFIESTPALEGYMINNQETATYTSGFRKYEI